MKVFILKTFGMSENNIPLKILKSINNVEKQDMSGDFKKEIVKRAILEIVDDNIDVDSLIDDLIELLIDISKKKLKILINSRKKCF